MTPEQEPTLVQRLIRPARATSAAPMDRERVEAIRRSWALAQPRAGEASRVFYALLFERAPQTRMFVPGQCGGPQRPAVASTRTSNADGRPARGTCAVPGSARAGSPQARRHRPTLRGGRGRPSGRHRPLLRGVVERISRRGLDRSICHRVPPDARRGRCRAWPGLLAGQGSHTPSHCLGPRRHHRTGAGADSVPRRPSEDLDKAR